MIPGTELTAKYGENEVHILAYDFDIDVAGVILRERNEIVRRQKIKEMEIAICLSRREGLEITDGLAPSEKQPVSLTVALDICANRANQNIFLERHGKRLTPESVYYEYQAPNKSCAVERSGVTVEWLAKKFRGVAQDLIIAHPFVSVSVVTKPLDEMRINDLLKIGATGVEVYHNQTSNEQIELLKKIVSDRAIHYTGGSDFHGKKNDTSPGQFGPKKTIPDFHLSRYQLSS
ncbi:MAG: hypothetical protein HY567_04225 [Candidatus Kerfeldbacteria bacterium]|nr:hypothetical protein [Candidatus Kerfeldbacteria bacterium]